MKTLVVYFSRSGVTKALAEQIARGCAADIEPVKDLTVRDGLFGYLKSLLQAAWHREALIGSSEYSPGDYELIVLGTPIWCWNMSSPIRSYIKRYQGQFRRVALFCTYGGAGQEKVLADMQALCVVVPIATLAVTTETMREGLVQQKVTDFARVIQGVERSTASAVGTSPKHAIAT